MVHGTAVAHTDGGEFNGRAACQANTGLDRIGSSSQQNIYRMQYTLSAPITLQAGEYWFSHDASIVPLPAAAWMGLSLLGGVGAAKRFRRHQS